MTNLGLSILSCFIEAEEFDKKYDDFFINYFRTNPHGFEEQIRLVKEKLPNGFNELIIERLTKLYEQAKKEVSNEND